MMTYYQILGLTKDTTDKEIKKAYRKLVMEHHPDKGGDEVLFAEITQAYEVLIDPEARKEYDETGHYVPKDKKERKVIEKLIHLFNQKVDEIVSKWDHSYVNQNPIRMMKQAQEDMIDDFDRQMELLEKRVKVFKEVKDKLKYNGDEEDILSGVIETKIRMTEESIEEGTAAKELALMLKDKIVEYSYKEDDEFEKIKKKGQTEKEHKQILWDTFTGGRGGAMEYEYF